MSRRVKHHIRSHAGGVNRALTAELLNATELYTAKNARDWIHGEARKRSGTQRIHTNQLGSGARVVGVTQWDSPAGRQVVAVCGGKLYHKLEGASVFSEVAASLSTSVRTAFVVHRVDGVPTLYLADGSGYYSWDGSLLTQAVGAPTMRHLAVYKYRMFGADADKEVDWSAVDAPEDWSILNGAGMAAVETYDTESITGIIVVGSSLLVFKKNNIARYSGYDRNTIDIDTGTEGVSPEVGMIGGNLVLLESVAMFMSDRGPYLTSEARPREIGYNIRPVFDFADEAVWRDLVLAHNRRRKEAMVFMPGEQTDTQNTVAWVYNYEMQTWWGPWNFGGFNVSAACRYERSTGQESVLLGGYDGWIRDGDVDDVGGRDDVLYNGTGGANVVMQLVYSPVFFKAPNQIKLAGPAWHIRADLKGEGELILRTTNEDGREWAMTVPTRGNRVLDYRAKPAFRGKEITITLEDHTSALVEVNSLLAEAKLGRATS